MTLLQRTQSRCLCSPLTFLCKAFIAQIPVGALNPPPGAHNSAGDGFLLSLSPITQLGGQKTTHLIHKKQWVWNVSHYWESNTKSNQLNPSGIPQGSNFLNSQLYHICCLLWLQNVNSLTPPPILSLSPSVQLKRCQGVWKRKEKWAASYWNETVKQLMKMLCLWYQLK